MISDSIWIFKYHCIKWWSRY